MNLLQRLAARATGSIEPARPRVPSVFEDGGGYHGLTLVDTTDERGGVHERMTNPSPSGPPLVSTRGRRPLVARADALFDVVVRSRPPAADPSQDPTRATVHGAVSGPVLAAPRAAVSTPRPARLPTPARPAPADAPLAGTDAHSNHVAADTPATERNITIHIGRLDIRANLQTPPSAQREHRPTTEPDLGLSDYLRGRRDRR